MKRNQICLRQVDMKLILINVVNSDETINQYSLSGNILRADSKEYEVPNQLSEDLIKIYDSLDISEKEFKEES